MLLKVMKSHKGTNTHEDVYRSKTDHVKMYTIPPRKLFSRTIWKFTEVTATRGYQVTRTRMNHYFASSLQDTSTETLRKRMGKKPQGGCTVLNLRQVPLGNNHLTLASRYYLPW